MSMRIAICDDDRIYLSQVSAVAKEYIKERNDRSVIFAAFSHPEDLLETAEKIGGYDIYILDVIMPGMSGIELGAKLRDAGYDGKIIYLTSSEEYSLDAFRVRAFDYIIKPIVKETFYKTMDEAMASISEKKDKILLVKTKDRSVKLTFESIMYAAFTKRAVYYYLVGGRTVESLTLRTTFSEAMADLIADKRFMMTGQSMVVNLDHITEIEADTVVFGNTYRALLGEKNCRKLRTAWTKYLFDEEGTL